MARQGRGGLTDYATVSRYPGDDAPLGRVEAAEAVEAAETVDRAARARLETVGPT